MDEPTHNAYEAGAARFADGHEQADVAGLHALLRRWLQPGMAVLEIGGGAGRDASFLYANGVDAWLSDGSSAMLMEAVRRHPELAGRVIDASFPVPTDHPLLTRSFDGVMALAVLMHLPDDVLFEFAFQVRQLLRPDGILILSASRDRPGLSDDRDAAGRLFRERAPGEIRLLFERLGFRLQEQSRAADSRGRGITWDTMVLRLVRGDTAAPVDQIETIISRDRKSATYKLALLRSLCDIAQTEYRQAVWYPDDTVSVPLGVIAERWLLYYWPLVEADLGASEIVFPQQRGGEAGRQRTAFRSPLRALVAHFGRAGGLDAFYAAYRDHRLDDAARDLVCSALNTIAETIVSGPVTYAGGALADDRRFFWHSGRRSCRGRYGTAEGLVASLGRVHMRGEVWREFCLLGHWIGEALVLRWAELTHEFTRGKVSVASVVERLLVLPDTERDQDRVRDLYASLPGLRCVWTEVPLGRRTLEIDHVVPFTLWRNNDIWNLLPTSHAANSGKRDALVGRTTLWRRRDAVIGCWEHARAAFGERFHFELGRSLLGGRPPRANWQTAAFTALDEAIETIAGQRGLPRWDAPGLRTPAGFGAVRVPGPQLRPQTGRQRAEPAAMVRLVLLPHFPDLRIACGVPNGARTEYATTTVHVPVPRGRRLSAPRHFVVRAEGDSMDGGNTPIRAGDYVVLEWIDAAKAGSLSGERAVVVEYDDGRGATSYVLKQVRKDAAGRYWLHSWNHACPDTPVDPSSCRPRARLVCNLGPDVGTTVSGAGQ